METVVLVEGVSDQYAIEALAVRLGYDLARAGVTVVPLGGATNVRRYALQYAGARLVGLCDRNEERHFRGVVPDVFVCVEDLEDELIRALGHDATEAVIEAQGELASLRLLQNMPFHRGGSRQDQLRRFAGVRSGRKHRYGRLLAESVPLDRIPPPLRDLLDHVRR